MSLFFSLSRGDSSCKHGDLARSNSVGVSFGTIFLCKSEKYDILSTAGISLPLCGRGGGGARYPSNFSGRVWIKKRCIAKERMGQVNFEEILALEGLS
jgi:hypothetical protein